jgi:hypothetical protein
MTWPTQLSAEPKRQPGGSSRGQCKITTTVRVTVYEDLREDKPAANAFMRIDA